MMFSWKYSNVGAHHPSSAELPVVSWSPWLVVGRPHPRLPPGSVTPAPEILRTSAVAPWPVRETLVTSVSKMWSEQQQWTQSETQGQRKWKRKVDIPVNSQSHTDEGGWGESWRSEAGFAEVCFLECFVCLDNLQQCCELIMNHQQLNQRLYSKKIQKILFRKYVKKHRL